MWDYGAEGNYSIPMGLAVLRQQSHVLGAWLTNHVIAMQQLQ